jgi:hypothetical protein
MRLCYMSLICRHTWETDTAIVFEKNNRASLYVKRDKWGVTCSGRWVWLQEACHVKLGKDLKLLCLDDRKWKFSFEVAFKKSVGLLYYLWQNFLYCTVTTEKAAKHIAASRTRKWPHRPIFSTSSRCCMYLWMSRGILISPQEACKGHYSTL